MGHPTRAISPHSIAAAIITFQRPELLEGAVRGVLRELNELTMSGRLIVVDNDPAQSARAVIAGMPADTLDYVGEPAVGIAAARNAAIDAATDCRLLAFIDDDEIPEAGWLQALVDAWEQWGCDGVTGPNLRRLGAVEDPWVTASGFFEPVRRQDGATVRGAATSNLLLDLATVRRLGLRFDDRFGTTGGSDTLFTRQLTARGGVIRWCERATTIEPVPPERASRQWILARDARVANTWSRVHLVLADGTARTAVTVVWLAGLAAKLVLTGATRLVVSIPLNSLRHRARGEREIARARGLLMGLFGASVEEYRRS